MGVRTRHLFLATARATFGEILVGQDLARQLHQAGDHVAFLHPAALSPLFRSVPYRHGTIDLALSNLAEVVRDATRALGFETIVLVDVSSVLYSAGPPCIATIIRDVPALTMGVDLWNLPETDLTWDVGEFRVHLDRLVLDIPSLRPAPIARPDAPGSYRALPIIDPPEPDERMAVRAELGLPYDANLILTATGAWQQPTRSPYQQPQRLAHALPGILELVIARLPSTYLMHVGPEPFAWGIPANYRFSAQIDPPRFRRLVRAADLMLSVNTAATSVAAAVAAGTPAVVLINSTSGPSIEAIEASRGATLPEDVRAWVRSVAPLYPFRVCPVGLHSLMAPVLAGNPYETAIEERELLDIDATVARIGALMRDGAERSRALAAQAAYRARIAILPDGITRFREITARESPRR